jgi:hypothetical protein
MTHLTNRSTCLRYYQLNHKPFYKRQTVKNKQRVAYDDIEALNFYLVVNTIIGGLI